MTNVGDILGTLGDVQYHRGKIFCYLSISTVLNTPTVLIISPHSTHYSPTVLKISPRYYRLPSY